MDKVLEAMRLAARGFGGSEGVFNLAGFRSALAKLADLEQGGLDGNLCRAILEGRRDCEQLSGGAHYRLLAREGDHVLPLRPREGAPV